MGIQELRGATDCYLVKKIDRWDGSPRRLSFASLYWGDEKKKSFAQVVKDSMAGRGRGGCRPRFPAEEWEGWGGGWFPPPQPGYPHSPYHPPPQRMATTRIHTIRHHRLSGSSIHLSIGPGQEAKTLEEEEGHHITLIRINAT